MPVAATQGFFEFTTPQTGRGTRTEVIFEDTTQLRLRKVVMSWTDEQALIKAEVEEGVVVSGVFEPIGPEATYTIKGNKPQNLFTGSPISGLTRWQDLERRVFNILEADGIIPRGRPKTGA